MTSGRPFSIGGLRAHVRSSQEAGTQFEALGFLVTPQSQLPGLTNRLVCFEPPDPRGASFIELLSIVNRATASPAALDLLGTSYGPIATILSSDDAIGLARALKDDRIEPRHIKRKWNLGSRVLDVEVVTLNVPRAISPLGWAMMEHRTPQHYRIPEFVRHPNGVSRFRAAIAVAPRPAEVAQHFRLLWDGTLSVGNGHAQLSIGAATLEIYTPEALQSAFGIAWSSETPQLVGAALEAADHDALIRWVRPKGLVQPNGGRPPHLPSSQACGCLLVFVPPRGTNLP